MSSNLWPPLEASAPADPDLSGEHADWGAVNREELARKLYGVAFPYTDQPYPLPPFEAQPAGVQASWLAVADTAVAEILGVAP